LKRHAQLGADAISAGDKHGIADLCGLETKQPAEGADLGEHTGSKRFARQRADPSHDVVTGLDVDTSLFVIHQKSSV
jgi:hypothetical protein